MKTILLVVVLIVFVGSVYGQESLSLNRSEVLFSKGLDLMAHREFGAAREHFDKYLASTNAHNLRHSEAEYYKAFCSVKLYHPDGEKQLEDFIQGNALNPLSVTAYYDLGTFFYDEKNYTKASSYFSKADFSALTSEQQNTGHFKWGYALFNQKKLKESLEQFNFIKAQGGQYGPAASYYAGFIEFSTGDYANAVIDLKRAESNSSYSTIVPYVLANVYYKQKQYDELLGYATVVQSRPGVSNADEIALLVAEAYFQKGDYTTALKNYKQYLSTHDKADRNVLLRAGYSAFAANDNQALDYLKSAASDQDSTGYFASYYLGAYYLKQQQKPLALLAFGNARNFKADKKIAEESSFQYAKIAYDVGRAEESINQLEAFIKDYPQSSHVAEAKELLGSAYVNANNYNRALEYIEGLSKTSAAIDQAYQKAAYLKGAELFNKEQYPQAVEYFEKSLTRPVNQEYVAEASFWCGEAYSIGKRYDAALPHYERIISLSGLKNADLMINTRYALGYCHYNMQKYDRALFNFKEFTNKGQDNPNYADGILRLADCYYVQKSYTDALAQYRKALQQKTSDSDYAHLQAGVVLGIQRKYNEALAEFDQVVKNYATSRYAEEALFQRGQLLFEQGNYNAATAEFGRLINRFPSSRFLPYAHMRRAASYYNLKDYTNTVADYVVVVERFPGHPAANDVLLALQEALNLSGRSGEFEQYLAKFKAANPDGKGLEAVEFETAKNLYFNQSYDRAARSLESYVNNYPASPRAVEAKYYRAESFYRMKDFDKSLEVFYGISDMKSFEMINRVTARIAELEFKKGRYQKAIPFYHRLAKVAANKKEQYNAWSGLMDAHFQLAQYDSCQYYAKIILEQGNVNAGAQSKASLLIGKSAMAKRDYETAKDEFVTIMNTARDEYGAEAKYLLGEIFYLTKDHKQCYETLISLPTDFSAYDEWVGKAFLLLADNFMAEGKNFQAKATLNSLKDFPLAPIRDQAMSKLKQIEKDELSTKVTQDTTDN